MEWIIIIYWKKFEGNEWIFDQLIMIFTNDYNKNSKAKWPIKTSHHKASTIIKISILNRFKSINVLKNVVRNMRSFRLIHRRICWFTPHDNLNESIQRN
jgi:hypothetical protein